MFSFLRKKKPQTTRLYLDYASTTPVDPQVAEAMGPYLWGIYGNPGARHDEGFAARDALVGFRKQIARTIEAHEDEITFTSGGTEANNLAILGLVRALEEKGKKISAMHAIVSVIEHPSVLECFLELHRRGMKITWLRPDAEGLFSAELVEKHVSAKTVLVSIGLVNGEIGTIAPLRKISRALKREKGQRIYLHTDASQAPLYLSLLVDSLGIDLMTVDAQKIYGPKGVGFLYHKRNTPLAPILFGGGQESGLRPGTVPLELVAGIATAFSLAQKEWKKRAESVRTVRDYLAAELKRRVGRTHVNGSLTERVANNVNASFPGIDGEYLAALINAQGVAVATKSACVSDEKSSYVIEALGGEQALSTSSIRISLPQDANKDDANQCVEAVIAAIKKFDKA